MWLDQQLDKKHLLDPHYEHEHQTLFPFFLYASTGALICGQQQKENMYVYPAISANRAMAKMLTPMESNLYVVEQMETFHDHHKKQNWRQWSQTSM